MNPSELHTLFTDNEQTLLVATERARLDGLTEDDLDELLTRVRRARNKYTKLYRRQSANLVTATSSRAGTSTSNQRTKRKAEIFEGALARVASALATAARATSKKLKEERLAAATAAKGAVRGAHGSGGGASTTAGITSDQPATKRGGSKGGAAAKGRRASNAAAGSRRQAKRDSR